MPVKGISHAILSSASICQSRQNLPICALNASYLLEGFTHCLYTLSSSSAAFYSYNANSSGLLMVWPTGQLARVVFIYLRLKFIVQVTVRNPEINYPLHMYIAFLLALNLIKNPEGVFNTSSCFQFS